MGWGSLGEETDLAVSCFGIKDSQLVFESPNDWRRMMMETNGENPTVGSRAYLCYCTLSEDHLWLLGTGCTHTVTIRKLIMENAEVSFPSPASLGSMLQFHLPSNVTGQCAGSVSSLVPGFLTFPFLKPHATSAHRRSHAWPGPARGHFPWTTPASKLLRGIKTTRSITQVVQGREKQHRPRDGGCR